jgi:hypothetical protein
MISLLWLVLATDSQEKFLVPIRRKFHEQSFHYHFGIGLEGNRLRSFFPVYQNFDFGFHSHEGESYFSLRISFEWGEYGFFYETLQEKSCLKRTFLR